MLNNIQGLEKTGNCSGYTKVLGNRVLVKIVDGGLYFIFSFHFILFFFYFSFLFLFLEQLGLGFISHAVTSVTN